MAKCEFCGKGVNFGIQVCLLVGKLVVMAH